MHASSAISASCVAWRLAPAHTVSITSVRWSVRTSKATTRTKRRGAMLQPPVRRAKHNRLIVRVTFTRVDPQSIRAWASAPPLCPASPAPIKEAVWRGSPQSPRAQPRQIAAKQCADDVPFSGRIRRAARTFRLPTRPGHGRRQPLGSLAGRSQGVQARRQTALSPAQDRREACVTLSTVRDQLTDTGFER